MNSDLTTDFLDALEGALYGSVRMLQEELRAQGHYNTGNLNESMEVKISLQSGAIVGEVSAPRYLDYVNRRTKHSKITGAQIAGLTKYFEDRGLSGRELEGAVWGTARKQVQGGSPTPGSFRFTTNGRRTGAIDMVFKDVSAIIAEQLTESIQMHISRAYIPAINEAIKTTI